MPTFTNKNRLMATKYTAKVDARITPDLEQQIRLDAQKEGRSFSGQIRWMLESYYKNKQLELERELDKPGAK